MDPLRTHRVILCEQLDVGKIIPYLRQDRMLTADEYETLTNPIYNTKVRRNKLLDMMPRKGKRYFEHFGKSLVWSGQADLARHIGVDVDKVPAAPYELEPEPEPMDPYAQMLKLFSNSMQSGAAPPPSNALPYNPNVSYPSRPPVTVYQPTYHPYPAATTGYPSMQAQPPSHLGAAVNPLPVSTGSTLRPIVGGISKVFILYCKDTHIPGIDAQTWSDSMLDLANLLQRCGNIQCTIDHYESKPQTNWNRWTIDRINESNFVVLVLSPTLSAELNSARHHDLHMEHGQFFCDSIANMVEAPLFVPVFLNRCRPPSGNAREWLPPSLAMGSIFELHNFSDLVRGYTEGTPEEDRNDESFYTYIADALADSKFVSTASLISHLRGELGVERPPPPVHPVTIHHTASHPPISHQPPQLRPNPEAEYISPEDLNTIASRVNREWHHLGIRLGLTQRTGLMEISQRHPTNFKQAALEMLYKWQQLKGRMATRRALKKALLDQSLGRLASEIFPDEQI